MTATPFRLPLGTTVSVELVDGSRTGDAPTLTFEVDAETWHQIDMMMLFHLAWDKRHEGDLTEGGNVQIVVRLDPELVESFDAAVSGDDLVAGFAALPEDDPLRSTQAWYGLEVTEAVPLPPSLADKGELRSGFRTVWADS